MGGAWCIPLDPPLKLDGALGFFEDCCPNEKKNKKSSDIWSVPDP